MGAGANGNFEGTLGMNTDIQGKIRNTSLPKSKPLCPLFEAISNSIRSISESGRDDGIVEITLERDKGELDLGDSHAIKSIKIRDNGVGFNEENFDSFRTAESTYKLDSGAKGIGRFVWLKAFDAVNITSTFKENGRFANRSFDFLAKGGGIHEYTKGETDDRDLSTIVHLKDIKEKYSGRCPRDLGEIAHDIVEHFIIHFLLKTNPKIVLRDGIESINLDNVYGKQIVPAAKSVEFEINGASFTLFLTKLYSTDSQKHQIHLCAHSREVKNFDLSKHIRELYTKRNDEEGDYVYRAYVIGSILDGNVDSERADFTISPDDSLIDDIGEREILKNAVDKIRQILKDYIHEVKKKADDRIREHINHAEPQYKRLYKHRHDWIDAIPPGLSKEALSIELYRGKKEWVIDHKRRHNEFLEDDLDKIEDLDQYKQKYGEFVEESNDIGKSELVEYIIHRKSVLELLDRRLSIKSDKDYWKEKGIHELIFPLRKTSDDILFDQQNLWIIDERLSYHEYLASDKEINQMEPMESESKVRPDVVIFNTFDRSFAFANEPDYKSIVIIEFKRPGRDDFTDKDNPIDQVVGYIKKIKEGKVKDENGRPVDIGDDKANTPFYVYIMCDLSGKTREFIDSRNYTKTPDGRGYFYFHNKYNAYIEVISYNKLLKDSQERNRILFERLNLPMLIDT